VQSRADYGPRLSYWGRLVFQRLIGPKLVDLCSVVGNGWLERGGTGVVSPCVLGLGPQAGTDAQIVPGASACACIGPSSPLLYRRKPPGGLASCPDRGQVPFLGPVPGRFRDALGGRERAKRCERRRLGLKLHEIRPKKLCKGLGNTLVMIGAALDEAQAGEGDRHSSATSHFRPTKQRRSPWVTATPDPEIFDGSPSAVRAG
jgi:hypothetical protein